MHTSHLFATLIFLCTVSHAVLLKVVYMKIIVDVHDAVFDDAVRAERRLRELREMMSVVWDSSSDVIVVSVRGAGGGITTMVSPTYVSIFRREGRKDGGKDNDDHNGDSSSEKRNGLVFEFHPRDYATADGGGGVPSSLQVHDLEFTGLQSGGVSRAAAEIVRTGEGKLDEGMASLVELVFRAWNLSADRITRSGGDGRSSSASAVTAVVPDDVIISPRLNSSDPAGRWEAKITRLRDSALVMVLRDTSERSRRFEAEKKYVSESTARAKDAEANRFTRHEVKNGLLSAIGLCDSFGDSLQKIMDLQQGIEAAKAAVARAGDEAHLTIDAPDDVVPVVDPSTTVCLHELDRTLNEVLHMVLADAMAREIVHDVYEPRWEYADVLGCLSSHHHLREFQSMSLSDRFPIIVRPSSMPRIRCDIQLLSLIHRSAISNACKFGMKGGHVLTEVHFLKDAESSTSGVIEMRVTNLPGPNHNLLLEMGSVAERLVFSKGGALQNMLAKQGAIIKRKEESNGAWIVQKGASVMGGTCTMSFLPTKTEFVMRFPTDAAKKGDAFNAGGETPKERFKIPENTYGIAIDDSKIQRKLLERFLQYAGIKKDRIIVHGKDAIEIEGFVDFVSNFLDQHPNDHIFIIADE